MIRIIKEGNRESITYRFTCPNCKCVFVANGSDVATEFARNANGDYVNQRQLAKCPCCGRFVAGVEVNENGRV